MDEQAERRTHELNGLEARIESGKADPLTDSQRAVAARIRVAYDKRRGQETAEWIKRLARSA